MSDNNGNEMIDVQAVDAIETAAVSATAKAFAEFYERNQHLLENWNPKRSAFEVCFFAGASFACSPGGYDLVVTQEERNA